MSLPPASPADPEITPQAFAQLRSDAPPDPPVLLDVREPWEFQAARLPDSLLMPMGEVSPRALSVAMWLRNQGFERAQSLAGGIDAWSRSIDPTIPRY